MSHEDLMPWDQNYDAREVGEKLPGGVGRPKILPDPPPKTVKLEERKAKQAMRQAVIQNESNPILKTAFEKLQEHEFDPMDLLIGVAKGEVLKEDHPYLYVLMDQMDQIDECMMYSGGEGVLGIVNQIRIEARGYLMDSYTPKEQRIKVAQTLMEYTRPKLKMVEHAEGQRNSGPPVPLSPEEVESFSQWFESEF